MTPWPISPAQAFAADAPENQARLFNEFHALTVAVGKAHCRSTAHCAGCPLAADLECEIRTASSRRVFR